MGSEMCIRDRGTGKVLSGLAKRAAPDARVFTLDTLDDILGYLG